MSDNTDPTEFDLNEFERQLEALFTAEDPEEVPDPEEEPDGGGSDEEGQPEDGPDEPEATEPPPDPPAERPSRVQILDRELDSADAQALVEFYDWVQQNPAKATEIDNYLRGQAQFVPNEQQQAPAPDPIDDSTLEDLDPAVKRKLDEIDDLKAKVAQFDQVTQQQAQAQVQSALTRGAEAVQTKYALTDEEMAELQQVGASLNVLPGLIQSRGDMVAAVEETLDMAYWRTEKFRDAAVARYAEQQVEDQKRQTKASSLSGGSGSVPRTPKAPSTNEDRRQGMVAAIQQAMTTQQE